jgi:hypothetical protein
MNKSLLIQGLIILLVWSSPFWLDWKLIFLGIFVYYLQLIIFKEDILTKTNFKTKQRGEMTFYSFLLEKIGLNLDRKRMQMIADYIFPWLILLVAYYLQTILNLNVLLKIY